MERVFQYVILMHDCLLDPFADMGIDTGADMMMTDMPRDIESMESQICL